MQIASHGMSLLSGHACGCTASAASLAGSQSSLPATRARAEQEQRLVISAEGRTRGRQTEPPDRFEQQHALQQACVRRHALPRVRVADRLRPARPVKCAQNLQAKVAARDPDQKEFLQAVEEVRSQPG